MWNENGTGRRVGYHRKDASQVFNEFQTLGERFSQVFVDKELSQDDRRPELRNMIGYLRKDDLVVVESLHALGYSFSDCQLIVRKVLEKECSLQVRDENLMFSYGSDSRDDFESRSNCDDEQGCQSMLRLLSAVARAEASMFSELFALKSAKAAEKPSFKPNVRATVSAEEATRIQDMKKAGISTGALQKEFGLSRGAVNRILTASSQIAVR